MNPMAMRVTEMGASEGCPVTGQIEVASPSGDKITSPETELTSCWCSTRELPRNSAALNEFAMPPFVLWERVGSPTVWLAV
jgi:hypothetical protein